MSRRMRDRLKSRLGQRPKPESLSEADAVTWEPRDPGDALTRVVKPKLEGVHLTSWVGSSVEQVRRELAVTGALLFRGFDLQGIEDFQRFAGTVGEQLVDYNERSTPRSEVSGKVYTSTEYPADQHIPLHNEMSYAHSWPTRIWFYCVQAAPEGGETPIADSRRVLAEIPGEVRDRFSSWNLRYVRNFGEHLGLPWQEVFQTTERGEVEAFCRRSAMTFTWQGDGRLRTEAVRPAVWRHPVTDEAVWFNQAHLHHLSSLDEESRTSLLSVVSEDELPFNTYYGDGSPIADDELDAVRAAYDRVQVRRPWQEGDVLMLDNVLVAHGRTPFRGPRKIVVAMGDPQEFPGAATQA